MVKELGKQNVSAQRNRMNKLGRWAVRPAASREHVVTSIRVPYYAIVTGDTLSVDLKS